MEYEIKEPILLSQIKAIDKLASKITDFHLKEIGLTRSQANVIVFLATNEGKDIHQRDIEQALSLTNPSVNGLLNRLEEKDFIERMTDPTDNRARKIVLTENAKQIVDSVYKSISQTEEMLLEGLSEKETALISELLVRIAENASKNK